MRCQKNPEAGSEATTVETRGFPSPFFNGFGFGVAESPDRTNVPSGARLDHFERSFHELASRMEVEG